MARPASLSPKNSQINVRLTERQADGLAALEYVGLVSGPELLRDLLDAELERRHRDPLFVQALRLRIEARMRQEGGLRHLPSANEAS